MKVKRWTCFGCQCHQFEFKISDFKFASGIHHTITYHSSISVLHVPCLVHIQLNPTQSFFWPELLGISLTHALMPLDLRQVPDDQGEFYELPLRSPTSKSAPQQEMPTRGGITQLTVDIPSSRTSKPLATHPPRWKTAEFIFYGACFCIAVPAMVWIPVQLSSRMSHFFLLLACFWLSCDIASNPNYAFYEPRLKPGWLFGRKVVRVFHASGKIAKIARITYHVVCTG